MNQPDNRQRWCWQGRLVTGLVSTALNFNVSRELNGGDE